MTTQSAHWQKTAIALALSAAMAWHATPTYALALGQLSVLSAVGEPLRAEIDFNELSPEEAASLKVALPSEDIFRAVGLDYSAGLNQLTIQLQQRSNGQSFLQLQGQQAITSNFLNLVLQLDWSAGRIMRNYVLLLNPPKEVVAPAVTPSLPQSSPAAGPAITTSSGTPPAGSAGDRPAQDGIKVKYGDTAGRIAAANLPAGVSLDQMLVAMLRANPDAFVNNNVHRLKTGVILNMPSGVEAEQTEAPEARRIVLAQSRDFNAYRRKLADAAPKAPPAMPDRQAQGKVETQVSDKKNEAPSQDKLTLSKGAEAAPTTPSKEDLLSKQANEQEASTRVSELNKNLEELKKLSSEAAGVQPPAAAEPAEKAEAPGPSVPSPVPPPPAPTPDAVKPSLLNELMTNPAVPAAAAGLVLLLAALGIYRMRRRQRDEASPLNPVILEETEPPEETAPKFTLPPEPVMEPEPPVEEVEEAAEAVEEEEPPREINLDAIAEADVYLAYGRADQAEQVLLQALKGTPERIALHMKLLDIYVQQLDLPNFESTAREVLRISGPDSADWQRSCELGRSIDPDNPLYQPPSADAGADLPPAELDLDLPLDSGTGAAPETEADKPAEDTSATEWPDDLDALLDKAETIDVTPDAAASEPAAEPAAEVAAGEVEPPPAAPEDDDRIDLEVPPIALEAVPVGFDLNSISLDLEVPPSTAPAENNDPLAVKLALAEEFGVIGDTDGARALLEEVLAEASSEEMKTKAQAALDKLI